MTEKELWHEYCLKSGTDENTPYEAWAFGDDSDGLALLVKSGIKTATASAAELYALDGEPLPETGDFSVILDSNDDAVCVIRDTKITVTPYCEVTAEHAFREGEGDRSLAYWRQVHEPFFRNELESYGIGFDENMKVLCEEFEVLYVCDGKN